MKICLYGAASNDIDKSFLDAAYDLGSEMAARGHTLVYGGGATGVMGATARGLHDHGGSIIGIAPTFFNTNHILYEHCTEFFFTETMQQRKKMMMEKAEAFIMAPGGIGTFEEFFEILTLKQLGRHNPAIAVYNTNNYYQSMQQMLAHTAEMAFMKPACLELYKLFDTPQTLLDYLETYDPNALDVRHLKNI